MKKTSALLVLIFCTFLPVCGISGQRGLSPDICEVLSSTILMPYEIPNATRGNKTQKNRQPIIMMNMVMLPLALLSGSKAATKYSYWESMMEPGKLKIEADRLFISRMKDSPV
mgnify:CR=1 FL=1